MIRSSAAPIVEGESFLDGETGAPSKRRGAATKQIAFFLCRLARGHLIFRARARSRPFLQQFRSAQARRRSGGLRLGQLRAADSASLIGDLVGGCRFVG